MPDKTQINIKIDPDIKKDWEAHIDEHDQYASLTHFLRYSAGKQIRSDNTDADDSDQSIESAKNEILREIDDVDRTVNRVDNQMMTSEDTFELFNNVQRQVEQIESRWNETIKKAGLSEEFVEQAIADIFPIIARKIDGEIETINGEEVELESFIYENIDIDQLKEATHNQYETSS